LGLSKRRKALITLATLIGTFLAALAVATFFPRGTAKELVSREEDYG
jgi:hypothetical protein